MKYKRLLFYSVLIVFLLLVSSGINAFSMELEPQNYNKNNTNEILTISKQFSAPILKNQDNFLNVYLKEANSYIKKPGEPVIPCYKETFEFPLGTRIKDIEYSFSLIDETQIPNDIFPASKPGIYQNEQSSLSIERKDTVYKSDQYYPKNWYSFKTTGGLNKQDELTTFLKIQLNPIRYNPVKKTLQSLSNIKLKITYVKPTENIFNNDEFDLLIISYDLYIPQLKPLVDHKNSHDVKTKLISLSSINKNTSINGRDSAEKVKFFIKDSIEKWGIKYVMLVGNFKKFPTRKTHLETDAGGPYEELEFACDLYYADIYDSEGNFSSWDTDEDENYGEWPCSNGMEDLVDLSPDVYIGRLACMHYFEVKTMVDKIIEYETKANNSDWFNTMIVCGGDTFDKSWEAGTDYDEGEVANEKALEYMSDFDHVKIYASLDNLTNQNIHDQISKGAGFLYFVGHGNPKHWATHKNGDYLNWTEGISNRDMLKLTNDGQYPILMVGGCHNSEFCTTPINFIKGVLTEGIGYFLYGNGVFGSYYLYNWVPECWSWVFVKAKGGGAIASMGSVGYGGVRIGDDDHNDIPDCIEGLDGWFETQFFRLYNEENIDILGKTYYQTVTDYINNFPVHSDRYDGKIVETHVLLGDPSLKIGGY